MAESSSAAAHRIYFRLQRAAQALKKRADEALSTDGELTTAQAAVLMIIRQNGPVSQREVARILQHNESAMTAMVQRLLALGHVERRRSLHDVRRWELSVTLAGQAALLRATSAFSEVNHALESALVHEELATLARLLDSIIEMGTGR
ncbi:MarR family winged helix-turn-helix transcriptional regulator [Erythrobacter mangrovi]|uniref:Winged helix-turn-helix transcriptional regulator n=1 Tax=Erythrobacter mangrovi TaxID=2739433 RepID=A0A7D4CLF3_9SPHN|nr:MarR family winged helix-turn-helix transcriptional regulator [Erythrobacter mangrovi]QKG70528.1 winged helix-turn-helix transcriptional regulator [Erythrobacter mangrovi]